MTEKTVVADWSAEQYSKFERERTIPALDLVNAIEVSGVQSILDVGCGPGNSTAVLKKRFPDAHIIGVDNSDDMLASAQKKHPDLAFRKVDVPNELDEIGQKFDIVFSNACLQWIPNHTELLRKLMSLVNDGGVLAVQMPSQEKLPLRKLVQDVAASGTWADKISVARKSNLLAESEYFDVLSEIASDFSLWETAYFHAMPSHEAIVEWYKSTGLRPYLEQLSDGDKAAFERDVLCAVEKAYSKQKNGEIIFRFPRLFFIAKK